MIEFGIVGCINMYGKKWTSKKITRPFVFTIVYRLPPNPPLLPPDGAELLGADGLLIDGAGVAALEPPKPPLLLTDGWVVLGVVGVVGLLTDGVEGCVVLGAVWYVELLLVVFGVILRSDGL